MRAKKAFNGHVPPDDEDMHLWKDAQNGDEKAIKRFLTQYRTAIVAKDPRATYLWGRALTAADRYKQQPIIELLLEVREQEIRATLKYNTLAWEEFIYTQMKSERPFEAQTKVAMLRKEERYISRAAGRGDIEAIKLFFAEYKTALDQGDLQATYCLDQALTAAACHGQAGVLALLIENGTDPDLRLDPTKYPDRWTHPNTYPEGRTALMVAAGYGHIDGVKILLENGADVFAKTRHNLTALYEAKRTFQDRVISVLNGRALVEGEDEITPQERQNLSDTIVLLEQWQQKQQKQKIKKAEEKVSAAAKNRIERLKKWCPPKPVLKRT